MYWTSSSGLIELNITRAQAQTLPRHGDAEHAVRQLLKLPKIRRQMDRIEAKVLADELKEDGAWDEQELADHEENKMRLLWLACGDLNDR